MQIRHVDAARDAAACAAIYAPYVTDGVVSLEEIPPSEREFTARIERISSNYPWLVAEVDDRIVGYAYASQHRERVAYRWAADVTVYIDPRHHRRGIGRALYRTLFELIADQGIYVACAGITLPNAASVGLHEDLGFTPVGVYRGIAWKAGAWWDVGWWQLQLAPEGPGAPAELGPPVRLEGT